MATGLPADVEGFILTISTIISVMGIIIIVVAIGRAVYRAIRIEIFHDKRFVEYEHVKRNLIQKIIFALDFFVASDLIILALASTISEILNIAIIVAIRTVLSWSLSKEIDMHKE